MLPGSSLSLLAIRVFIKRCCDFRIYGSSHAFDIDNATRTMIVHGALEDQFFPCTLPAAPPKPISDHPCLHADAGLCHRAFDDVSLSKSGLDVSVDKDSSCVDCIVGKFETIACDRC